MKSLDSEITARFGVVIISLIGEGVWKNQAEAALFLGLKPQQMTNLMKGRQSAQLWMIHKLCSEFPKWLDFIFHEKNFAGNYALDEQLPSMAAESATEYTAFPREKPVVHRKDHNFTIPELSEVLREIDSRLKELEKKK